MTRHTITAAVYLTAAAFLIHAGYEWFAYPCAVCAGAALQRATQKGNK